ncbi:MAG: phage holin family protein [Acidimicrobiia bacterium]
MSDPTEIPQLTSELIEMSREYLRQETIEPAKKLGKHAGLGLGGAVLIAFGVICFAWGLYFALTYWLPEGEWWIVLARFITALVSVGVAGLIGWRIQATADQIRPIREVWS